jgi:hypothetical protein
LPNISEEVVSGAQEEAIVEFALRNALLFGLSSGLAIATDENSVLGKFSS